MGRKKKPYINKKNAVTFNLVHRSQNDPLLDEHGENQLVLAAKNDPLPGDHTSEQHKYGIYYNDDYDYLQHLKEPCTVYPVAIETSEQKSTPLDLPHKLFGTEVNVEGLDRVVPLSGPQPDWDPEISEALDRLDGGDDDSDGSLEDDFVLQANGGEPTVPVYCEEQDEPKEPWWLHRGDFEVNNKPNNGSEGLYDVVSDGDSQSNDGQCCDRKTARFTEYSMTSSVIPRSEGLTNLDEKFEELMISYDDDQIGPLNEEDEDCCDLMNDYSIENIILNDAVEEFVHKYQHLTSSSVQNLDDATNPDSNAVSKGYDGLERDHDGPKDNDNLQTTNDGSEVSSSDNDERERLMIDQKEEWDCETILSTYSNLYNHPTLIKEPINPRYNKLDKNSHSADGRVESRTSHRSNDVQSISSSISTVRPKHESKEDRKLRKQAVKQERREQRQAKKALKVVFKKEQLRQEKELISNPVLNKIS